MTIVKAIKDQVINVEYISLFIDTQNATKIFNTFEKRLIYNSDSESSIKFYGKALPIKRKQVAYGEEGTFYGFSGNRVYARDWNNNSTICKIIKKIRDKVEQQSGESFNFVLINRYKDGDDYVGYHRDDEKDLDKYASIVGVSFGAERDILFKSTKNITGSLPDPIKLKLEHGSYFIMKYPTNDNYKHSIPKRKGILTPRISLTFRKLVVT